MKKSLIFPSKNSVNETPELTFSETNNVLSSFVMPQCHMSNYSCSLLPTVLTLHKTVNTLIRLIFCQKLSNIFYQGLKQVLLLKLSYFSQTFEYSSPLLIIDVYSLISVLFNLFRLAGWPSACKEFFICLF